MSILKLKPSCKDYLWGGHRLVEEYKKEYSGEVLAETWELSCHPAGPSYVDNGPYKGKTLQEYINQEGKQVLGKNCRRFRDFPILAKFIDARDNLSIQVHPDNRYALQNEGQYGKTEMWYVMEAGENSYLYYGFQREISREEFAERIQSDTLLEVLHAVPVQKGDVLFIESGTIHAIGKDILIAEIQQNSNVTYRVYDYGRVGKDGRKRDLHSEKALAVTNRVPIFKSKSSYPHVADCDYFTVDKLNLDGIMMGRMEGNVTDRSFVSLLFLDGEGTITCKGEQLDYKKGDSFFLSAGSGAYEIAGKCDVLITTIRENAGSVRVGVWMGGDQTQIGLVDDHQKILAAKTFATHAERGADAMIGETAKEILALLEQEEIPMDRCAGVGVGIAGTVDRRRGIVRYSNNIRWKEVDLTRKLSDYLPVPVRAANDADCTALGEALVGAGRDYQDVVMLTLGAGVGGGVILDGRIYDGRGMGGMELGHMVIVEEGEMCTCKRKGCLEAYVSETALEKRTKKVFGAALPLSELLAMALAGDNRAREVLDDYVKKLGTGLVNIVNIFRPQLILLGGGISRLGRERERLILEPLRAAIRENSFGGESGEIPELEVAALGRAASVIGAASILTS